MIVSVVAIQWCNTQWPGAAYKSCASLAAIDVLPPPGPNTCRSPPPRPATEPRPLSWLTALDPVAAGRYRSGSGRYRSGSHVSLAIDVGQVGGREPWPGVEGERGCKQENTVISARLYRNGQRGPWSSGLADGGSRETERRTPHPPPPPHTHRHTQGSSCRPFKLSRQKAREQRG
jgi:hypothetical protein